MQRSLRPRPCTAYRICTALIQQQTPCDVPTKLSAVSVFIYKGGNTVQEELDIVAEKCGCVSQLGPVVQISAAEF